MAQEGEAPLKRQKLTTDLEKEVCVNSAEENDLSKTKEGFSESLKESATSEVEINNDNKLTARNAISEKDAGILEYVSCHKGFHGVLKQRYVDFLVNERDLQGNLVRLTDLSVAESTKAGHTSTDDMVITKEDIQKIQEILDSEDMSLSVTLDADEDKEHRTKIHRAIRANYAAVLGEKCIHPVYTPAYVIDENRSSEN